MDRPPEKFNLRLQSAGIEAEIIRDGNQYLEKIHRKAKDIPYIQWMCDVSRQEFDYIYYIRTGGRNSVSNLNYIAAGEPNEAVKHRSAEYLESQKSTAGKILSPGWWWKSLITQGFTTSAKLSGIKEKRKVVDVVWKGKDTGLILRLNSDSELQRKLTERSRVEKDTLKMKLYYFAKHSYGMIETENFKPEPEDFDIFNLIARNMKAEWFR